MTSIEMWQLIFSGLTAVGTVGAVVFSLYVTVRRQSKFKIRKVEGSFGMILNEEHKVDRWENRLCIRLENQTEFPMHIIEAGLEFDFKGKKKNKPQHYRMGWRNRLNRVYIPALSHYDIAVDIPDPSDERELHLYEDKNFLIRCAVLTNFGEKSIKLPDEWRQRIYDVLAKKFNSHPVVKEEKVDKACS